MRRNIDRFPEDFLFELTPTEFGARYLPMAFTEQGVAILSSVLKSETAIRVNIQIIRIFTRMRAMIMTHKDILLQLEKIERNLPGMMMILRSYFNI